MEVKMPKYQNKMFKEVLNYFNQKLKVEGIENKDIKRYAEICKGDDSYIAYIIHNPVTHREIALKINFEDLPNSEENEGIPLDDLEKKLGRVIKHGLVGDVTVQYPEENLGTLLNFEFKGKKITRKFKDKEQNKHDIYFNRLRTMIYAKEGIDLAFEVYKN